MRLPASLQACRDFPARASRPELAAALFGKRQFNVFVWKNGANFDVSAEGADVVTQCSKFDFGAFFEAGNFALLHLHGERKFSLSHLAVLTQFVERHAFEDGISALFCAGTTSYAQSLNFSSSAGYAGQGSADGASTNAQFYLPAGTALDAAGNVYVADTANDMVRKITPDGTVSSFAGSSHQRGSADGQGTNARFWAPFGIAVDARGIIYVADTANNTIRKITPGGIVSTLAGLAPAVWRLRAG